MAIIRQGIIGKITGSLDGVTTYVRNGEQVIRQKAVNVHNPDTEKQQAVRDNLRYAVEIYHQLKPLLILSLRNRDEKQSIFSEFMRLNLGKSIVNSTLDFDKLVVFKPNASQVDISLDYQDELTNLITGQVI